MARILFFIIAGMSNNRMEANQNLRHQQKFGVGETVECWRQANSSSTSGWHLATIVSSRVDERNKRAYRYVVDWQDNANQSIDIQGKLIRRLPANFAPIPINTTSVPLLDLEQEVEVTADLPSPPPPLITDRDPTLLQQLINDGHSVVTKSLQATSDKVKRTLDLAANVKTAKVLYKQEKKETLKRVLALRDCSTNGDKRQLFGRAYPVHAKVLPPSKKKKKSVKEKRDDQILDNCDKRNSNLVRDFFKGWSEKRKNEV